MEAENSSYFLYREIIAKNKDKDLTAYFIALEGWRRGLTLTWHSKQSTDFNEYLGGSGTQESYFFSLTSHTKTHFFDASRGDKVSRQTMELIKNKDKLNNILNKAGLVVPAYKRFDKKNVMQEIITFSSKIGFPLLINIPSGLGKRSEVKKINDETQLRKVLTSIPDVTLGFYLEELVIGEEYRFYVIDGEIAGAVKKMPLVIVGNGRDTVTELIERYTKKEPLLGNSPVDVNEKIINYLLVKGYTLDMVLNKGEKIPFGKEEGVSLGDTYLEMSSNIGAEIKGTVVKTVESIPGFHHGRIDLIADYSQNNIYVVNVNPEAQLCQFLFPEKGQGTNIPAALVDFYFPETINKSKINYYFDLSSAIKPIEYKNAQSIQISPLPIDKEHKKKYILSGDIDDFSFHLLLKKGGKKLNLNGFIDLVSSNRLEVVVAGNNEGELNDFKELIQGYKNRDVRIVEEIEWYEPIEIGFKIKDETKQAAEALIELNNLFDNIEKEKNEAEKTYMGFQNSLSWRITKPLRNSTDYLKYIIKRLSVNKEKK